MNGVKNYYYSFIFWLPLEHGASMKLPVSLQLLNPMESGLNAKYTAVKAGFKIPLNDLTLVHRGRHTSLGFTVSAVRMGGTRHPTLVG
jgi:hypothetical protein